MTGILLPLRWRRTGALSLAYAGLAVLLLPACSDDPGTIAPIITPHPVDDGGPQAADAALDLPLELPRVAAPSAPLPPAFVDWVCPDGWVAEPALVGTPAAFSSCRSPALPDTCDAGSTPRLGDPQCQLLGSACPAGDYAEPLPSDRPVVYVQPGGTGDGSSPAAPLGSLAEALAQASDGALIALARGTHVGSVRIERGVELLGACASATRLTAASGDQAAATVVIGAGRAVLSSLAVLGPLPGLRVEAGGELLLSGVEVAGSLGVGLDVQADGSAVLDGVVLRDIGADPAGQGAAVRVAPGARVTVRATVIEGTSAGAALRVGQPGASRPAALEARDLVVRGAAGVALEAQPGAEVEIERALVADSRQAVILAASGDEPSPPLVTARNLVVVGHGGTSPAPGEAALSVSAGRLTARQLLIESAGDALAIASPAAAADLVDAVVRAGGRGLRLEDGAAAVVRRLLVERATELAMLVRAGLADPPVAPGLQVEDLWLSGIEQANGLARGLSLQGQVQAAGSRIWIQEAPEVGLFAGGAPGLSLSLADLTVVAADGPRGIFLQDGAQVDLTRVRIDGASDVGVVASGGGDNEQPTRLELTQLTLEAGAGKGIQVQGGAEVRVAGGTLAGRGLAGVAVLAGSSLEAGDLAITGTLARGVAGGDGMVVDRGTAALQAVLISDSARAGLVALDAGLLLDRVGLQCNPIDLALLDDPDVEDGRSALVSEGVVCACEEAASACAPDGAAASVGLVAPPEQPAAPLHP